MKPEILACGLLLSVSACVSAATITLQQGTNAYTGCTDSYISRHGADTKAGNNTKATLQSAYDNYKWNSPGW